MKAYIICCENRKRAAYIYRQLIEYLKEQKPIPICRILNMRLEIDFIGLDTVVKFVTYDDVAGYISGRHGEKIYINVYQVERFLDEKK